jgi:phosphoglycolate phosphatase-like HAD superfamily hydrolase
MFETLRDKFVFGVATGRPRAEALPPLRASGILDYFDASRIVTHDEVVAMEAAHPGQSFGKPNPFILHRAMGDVPAASTVFVGDTLSDVLAAGRAQVRSIGVLHSLPAGEYREARRKSLAEAGCATILETVLDLPAVLLEKR